MKKSERPRVYLEEDCPVAELSVESQRERGASSALPPLYFLHVWWARRPLTVSRASVLGSLLPAGYPREDFLELMGIPKGKNPVAEKERINAANKRGEKLEVGFSYKRGFSNTVPERAIEKMRAALIATWGIEQPTVLDSFAGGGSIPFEAYRMGLDVILNELNPVASVIERATIEYPAKFGPELAKDIETWGNRIAAEVEKDLAKCFPKQPGEEIFAYIWVRTVVCPQCELQVPLAPNWWLDKTNKLGYQLEAPQRGQGNTCAFRIRQKSSTFNPDKGTAASGASTCPRCATPIEGEHIKKEAQQNRMGHQLAVIGFKVEGKNGRFFREVTQEDLAGIVRAEEILAKRLPAWEQSGLLPTEEIDAISNYDRGHRLYGVSMWRDFFSPRQLLVHLVTLDAIQRQNWDEVKEAKRREALKTYMALIVSKGLDWNSISTTWHPSRVVAGHTFQKHNFQMKWSYCEMDGSLNLMQFCVNQILDSYKGLATLASQAQPGARARYFVGDAAHLDLGDKSIMTVSVDPPYYDNVMYAELADFFYVWMKRSLANEFPQLFSRELSDKDVETVANLARFRESGRKKARSLADEDYTAKMLAAFREVHRVLRDDGVLTIMFTHKRVDAWDSLGRALVEAGFEITATWPVHTESENSLHLAKKNAAASTILLVCRKRHPEVAGVWWEDIKDEVRSQVRERAEKFAATGLRGQDTSIASFGPALQVISRQWPVKRKDGSVIRPDEALDIAREEVMTWLFERIAEGQVKAVDKWTRFYILAWYTFGAREFPFDEARKLALAVKVDLDRDLMARKVLEKKGKNVRLITPAERAQKGHLDPAKRQYDWDLDYVQAAIQAYDNGMGGELAKFHQRTGALARDGYRNAVSYLLDVLPRAKEVTEYHTLDKLWEGNLQDQVKRRKPRMTDPTFEKQQRLDLSRGEEEAEPPSDDADEDEADEE